MAVCPNCGNETSEGAVFCDQCGTRLPQPEVARPAAEAGPAAVPAGPAAAAPAGGAVICPSCGAGNVPGEMFCDFCGSPLDAPEPEVEAEAEAEPEAEAEVGAEAEVEPEAEAAEAPDKLTCPACGEEVQPDEAFCSNCGASLAQAPIPPEPVSEAEGVSAPEPPEPPEPPVPPEVAPEAAPEPEAAVEAAATTQPQAVLEVEPAAEDAAPTCPACGAEIEAGDIFCSTCGFALQTVTPAAAPVPRVKPPAAAPQAQVSPAPTAVGPRLVVSASGAEIPLPDKDEILVGREDPVSGIYPDVDLPPHGGEEGGVSRRHARLIRESGKYYVEDLDSTNFTFVNKQKLTPKTRQAIEEGDEIRFGRVAVNLQTA
jgi:hypothetical protein